MPGPVDESKARLLEQIERQFDTFTAWIASDLPPASTQPINPHGASYTEDDSFEAATGYNSGTGETTVPFTWGISVWNAGDVWFAS